MIPKTITEAAATKAFLSGQLVAFGEYRASAAETIQWRDKVTRAALSAPTLRHTVEFGNQSVVVNERVDEATFKVEDYKPPFVKGARVVVFYTSVTIDKGVTQMRGAIVPVS